MFQQQWPGLYEAFEDNAEQLRQALLQRALLPDAGQHVLLGVETRNLLRRDAQTEEDRMLVPQATLPPNAHVVCPGRVMSSVLLLPKEAGQGTCVVDAARVTLLDWPQKERQAVVERVVKRRPHPVIIGDRWSACAPFLARMTNVAARCLLRVARYRVFSCAPLLASPVSMGPAARIEHVCSVAMHACTVNRMQAGRAPLPVASEWKSLVGIRCIGVRHASWKSV